LLNLTGRNFQIDSASDVTVNGGSWGPASDCGGPYGGSNNSIRETVPSVAPTNILIENTVIHDVQSYNLINCHIEGLAIFAGNHVTVSNSKFYGNSIYDIFTQANSGGSPTNLLIENNWFAQTFDNSGANGHPVGSPDGIALGNTIMANVTVRNNRFNGILDMNNSGGGSFTNVVVSGNVGMQSYTNYPCPPSITWTNNIWQNDKCGSTDTNLNGAAMPYVKASNDASMDYTLTGIYANWTGSPASARMSGGAAGLWVWTILIALLAVLARRRLLRTLRSN
jgi:hypothetical protein